MSSDPSVPNASLIDQHFKPTDLVFGRTVSPVVNLNKLPKKGKLRFEYAEHCFIGDAITLTLANGTKVAASDHKFQLKDQLQLTYGQINGLAGDFYGTGDPISDGKGDQEQQQRFVRAFNTLADGGPRLPKEALDILSVLQDEVNKVNKALADHQDPSVVYSKLPDVSIQLQALTIGRSGIPGYLGLAQINWDHFGADARTAYNAGHAVALQQAISGDLEGAYALNAFADHFLEDSFSAGHLRTPRRLLHKPLDPTADLCAKYMHDEDNAIGLTVKNPAGESWQIYGDKRALDKVDEENKKRCVQAVQASADEVYHAYQTKQAPPAANYQAWAIAPTLESALGPQDLAPLFTFKSERRKEIKSRRLWTFKTDWWFWSTALEIKNSGWWNYPITINGVQRSLPYSSIAVATPREAQPQVFYQTPDGSVLQSEHAGGSWRGIDEKTPVFKAVLFSPLAAVSSSDGKETRVFYLDEQYTLQEYRHSAEKGWHRGQLGDLKIQAATNTAIAAFHNSGNEGGDFVHVYLQESDSDAIKELRYDGHWSRGATLPVALSGSSLAAVNFWKNGNHIRLYYQDDNLYIRELRFHEGSQWDAGDLNVGQAPGGVPISASVLGTRGDSVELQLYWRNVEDEIVEAKYHGFWGPVSKVVGGLTPGTQFAATERADGKDVKIYQQTAEDAVREIRSDGGSWVEGGALGN